MRRLCDTSGVRAERGARLPIIKYNSRGEWNVDRNPIRSAVAAGALVLALVFAGAASGNATTTLRIGLQSDADNLDPTTPRVWATTVVLNAICDKLIDVTPDLRYVPQLATEWSWSDDGKALTLKLRQVVKFHDGEPLDAAAVKFSIDRHRLMRGSFYSASLAPIMSVDVVDHMTVRINLSATRSPDRCSAAS